MAILPFEQITQRRDAVVAAPGVILWSSTTDLYTQEVINTNEVEEGEVEVAQMAPPSFFWDVVVDRQDYAFGGEYFGYGPFGGDWDDEEGIFQDYNSIGDEWYVEHGPIIWGEGAGENGVYP